MLHLVKFVSALARQWIWLEWTDDSKALFVTTTIVKLGVGEKAKFEISLRSVPT
jgi:hypothetical protein